MRENAGRGETRVNRSQGWSGCQKDEQQVPGFRSKGGRGRRQAKGIACCRKEKGWNQGK